MATIRVLIADDHVVVREGLAAILAGQVLVEIQGDLHSAGGVA